MRVKLLVPDQNPQKGVNAAQSGKQMAAVKIEMGEQNVKKKNQEKLISPARKK